MIRPHWIEGDTLICATCAFTATREQFTHDPAIWHLEGGADEDQAECDLCHERRVDGPRDFAIERQEELAR